MNTYPEMNEKIVGILRISDDAHQLYAALRIEELEQTVALYQSRSECIYCGAVLSQDDSDRDHWLNCPDHPAHERLIRLVEEASNVNYRRENEYRDLTHRLMDELVIRRTLDEQLRECREKYEPEQTCNNCQHLGIGGETCEQTYYPLSCVLDGHWMWEAKDEW